MAMPCKAGRPPCSRPARHASSRQQPEQTLTTTATFRQCQTPTKRRSVHVQHDEHALCMALAASGRLHFCERRNLYGNTKRQRHCHTGHLCEGRRVDPADAQRSYCGPAVHPAPAAHGVSGVAALLSGLLAGAAEPRAQDATWQADALAAESPTKACACRGQPCCSQRCP